MRLRILLFIFVIAGASGCFTTVKPNQSFTKTQINRLTVFDYSGWSSLLKDYVNETGRVDYAALKTNRERLDRFVALIGAVGPNTKPSLFPTKAHQLALHQCVQCVHNV